MTSSNSDRLSAISDQLPTTNDYFVFKIEDQRYAVALSAVEKVIRAVELISLPEAPEILLGLINMMGRIIPVVNIRKHLRLPDREIEINDRIIISQVSSHTIAFIADTVEGVLMFSQNQLDKGDQIFPEMGQHIEGVGKIDNDAIVICNIYKLFFDQDIDMPDA